MQKLNLIEKNKIIHVKYIYLTQESWIWIKIYDLLLRYIIQEWFKHPKCYKMSSYTYLVWNSYKWKISKDIIKQITIILMSQIFG